MERGNKGRERRERRRGVIVPPPHSGNGQRDFIQGEEGRLTGWGLGNDFLTPEYSHTYVDSQE